MELNKPVENPELLAELRKRTSVGNDRQAQINYMNNLMHMVATQASFLVLIKLEGERMQVNMINSPDGKTYIPLFTDMESLRKWEMFKDVPVQTVAASFDDVMGFLNDRVSGVVINPFSENLCITTPQLQHMKQVKAQSTQINEHKLKKDTAVQIGEPKEYPLNLVNAIKSHAETDPRIKEVHMKVMTREGEMSFLLIIDFDGELNDVFTGVAGAGRGHVPAGMFLEMVPLNSEFGQQVITTTFSKPIYKK